MGKGDKKTRRGKIVMGSYGVRRPKKKGSRYLPEDRKKAEKSREKPGKVEKEMKDSVEEKPAAKKAAAKKPAAKKPSAKKSAEITEENSETDSQDAK